MIGRNLELNSKELDDSFKLLEFSISQIFKKRCSKLSYEELYRNVYYLVLNRFAEKAYNETKNAMGDNIKQIYEEFIVKNNEKNLSEILQIWREINEMIKVVNSICLYLHKKYIVIKKIPSFLLIGKTLFINHFMSKDSKIVEKMLKDIISLFYKERKNEIIDKVTLTGITNMMVFSLLSINILFLYKLERIRGNIFRFIYSILRYVFQ